MHARVPMENTAYANLMARGHGASTCLLLQGADHNVWPSTLNEKDSTSSHTSVLQRLLQHLRMYGINAHPSWQCSCLVIQTLQLHLSRCHCVTTWAAAGKACCAMHACLSALSCYHLMARSHACASPCCTCLTMTCGLCTHARKSVLLMHAHVAVLAASARSLLLHGSPCWPLFSRTQKAGTQQVPPRPCCMLPQGWAPPKCQ